VSQILYKKKNGGPSPGLLVKRGHGIVNQYSKSGAKKGKLIKRKAWGSGRSLSKGKRHTLPPWGGTLARKVERYAKFERRSTD